MRRAILVLATLAIALLVGSGEPAGAQTTVMRIEPAYKVVSPGSGPFSVQVWVDDVVTTDPCPLVGGGPCGLGSYAVEIAFDPTVIAFQSFEDGPFLTSTGRAPYMCPSTSIRHHPENGVISYFCTTTGDSPRGPEGSGHLATVTFEPLIIGQTDLHLQNTELVEADPFGTDIPHTTQDGTVVVDYAADLSVAKTGPNTVTAPGNIAYNVQVTNLGPYDAEAVTLVDTLSGEVGFVSATPGCTYNAGPRQVTCDLGDMTLSSSESISITVSVAASKAGRTIINAADATSTTVDPNPANNHAQKSTTVDLANVNIVKSAPDQVDKGATDQYQIVVTSTGPSSAANVRVTDILPPGVVYVGHSTTLGSCTYYELSGDHIVWCTLGTMAPSTSATVTITVTFPDANDTVCNQAKAEWTQVPAGVKYSASVCTIVGVPDGDGDGCSDEEELGGNPALGGQRDPTNPWDFYDVPVPTAFNGGTRANRDKAISIINDVLAVLEYSGTSDGGPPNAGGRDYDQDNNGDGEDDGILYDRSPGAVWSDAPDGAITIIGDVLLVLVQVGHNCQAPP